MGWYEWLLFLHVLGTFLWMGAIVYYWAIAIGQLRAQTAGRMTTLMSVTRPADIAVGAGMGLALVFGIWLAIYVDGYELWDGWILAALVLWALAAAAGSKTGTAFAEVRTHISALPPGEAVDFRALAGRGLLFHSLFSLITVLLLADMIWKPGA